MSSAVKCGADGPYLTGLGAITALQGDASDARALLERGVALGREAGAPETVIALVMLGRTFVLLEDLERAEATVAEDATLPCFARFAS